MRIAVLGAGAIGSSLGALLAKNGHDVTLVGRRDQVTAIRDSGLRVDGSLGSFVVRVTASDFLDDSPDLLLLAVKTQDVEVAVRSVASVVRGVPVVTLQNGVRSDEIVARALPSVNLLSAVVLVTATYLTPGQVTLIERGLLILGRPHGPRDALVQRIAAILEPAVPISVSDNLPGAHWLKLIMNLNNALPALVNQPVHEVFSGPFSRQLAVRLMSEGVRVARQGGVTLESLPGVSVRTVRLLTRLPLAWAARSFGARVGRFEGQWPVLGSTLQSLRRGRPSEIDFLNGEVVDLGRTLGVPTPYNARVVELVHGVERSGKFLSPEQLPSLFAGVGAR